MVQLHYVLEVIDWKIDKQVKETWEGMKDYVGDFKEQE